MHHGLLCQTDETPDARELYSVRLEACEDCLSVAVPVEDQPGGEITWLVQAALGADESLEIRRRPPVAAAPRAALRRHGAQGE